MSTDHHTPWQDGVTEFKADHMNAPLGSLDAAIGRVSGEVDQKPYDIGVTYGGTLDDGLVLLRYPTPRPVSFAQNLGPSQAVAGTSGTGNAIFSLKKDGVEFATCTFNSGEVVGNYASSGETTFASGEILTLVAPASADTTLADLGFAISGVRI